MKQIILSLALFVYVILSFVQTTKSQAISKDAFLKKSKTNKTIAWILLGTGTGIAAYSLITINNYTDTDVLGFSYNITGALIAIGGGLLGAASIPLFMGASRNKSWAKNVTISNQKILLFQQNAFIRKFQPTVSFKISL